MSTIWRNYGPLLNVEKANAMEGNLLTKAGGWVIGQNHGFQPKALHLDHSDCLQAVRTKSDVPTDE
jgi:hypothetical protein